MAGSPPNKKPEQGAVSESDWGVTLESTTRVFERTHVNLTVNLENPDGSTSFGQNERMDQGLSIKPGAAGAPAAAAPPAPPPSAPAELPTGDTGAIAPLPFATGPEVSAAPEIPAAPAAISPMVETASAAAAPGASGGTLELSLDGGGDFQLETRVTPDRAAEAPPMPPAAENSLQIDTGPVAVESESLVSSLVQQAGAIPEAGTDSALPFSLSPDAAVQDTAAAPSADFEMAPVASEPSSPAAAPEASAFEMASLAETPAPAPAAISPASGGIDREVDQMMPYLNRQGLGKGAAAALAFAQPLGDAVIPGGAAKSPDEETLKSYLLLREQDVAALSAQLRAAMDQIRNLEDKLRLESAKVVELSHVVEEQEARIQNFEQEKSKIEDSFQADLKELQFQAKSKTDKAKLLEKQVTAATEEVEHIKERVRQDIRKIRVREKELENRLEIMKKDSESLLSTREGKIIELKRKVDLLEFNMDLLQDQLNREREKSNELRGRLGKAAQVVRVAGGLLDSNDPAAAEDAGKKAS
ncbi:MAG: hypothetical protein JNL01_06285 [Bdellovibrionales bacterium]|nr:hypothetical protein [Bdellovibrionales bacterium]